MHHANVGFVDIDIPQTAAGEWDEKPWQIKVRLMGYAQMDTQWQEQARNPNYEKEKGRSETMHVGRLLRGSDE